MLGVTPSKGLSMVGTALRMMISLRIVVNMIIGSLSVDGFGGGGAVDGQEAFSDFR